MIRLLTVLREATPDSALSLDPLCSIAAQLTADDDDVAALVICVLSEQSKQFDAAMWLQLLLPLAPQLTGPAALTALLDAGALVRNDATAEQFQHIYTFASTRVSVLHGDGRFCSDLFRTAVS